MKLRSRYVDFAGTAVISCEIVINVNLKTQKRDTL